MLLLMLDNPITRIAHSELVSKTSTPTIMVGTVGELEVGGRAFHMPSNPAQQVARAMYERMVRLLEESHVSPS